MKQVSTLLSTMIFAAVLITPQWGDAGAQQNKMKPCNAEVDAKGLTGEGKGDDQGLYEDLSLQLVTMAPARAHARVGVRRSSRRSIDVQISNRDQAPGTKRGNTS